MSPAKPSPHVAAYMRFLRLAAAIEGVPTMDSFGANERALFQAIVLAWSHQQPLSVRQAIGLDALGSPATLHKRLNRLRQLELVCDSSEPTDRRTKRLIPTTKGVAYAEQLGRAIAMGVAPIT